MTHGSFIWCDLSILRPAVTHAFYERVMGWRIVEDGTGYSIATAQGRPMAGLFPMPGKFRDMGMPSFWMSYIAVDDVTACARIAEQNGGKVELGPAPFEGGGEYALIRDPLGAGFTIYCGPLVATVSTGGAGSRAGHGLFVSDASAVTAFYAALFGWSFGAPEDGTTPVMAGGNRVAHLHAIPDPAVRGDAQYWAVIFTVDISDAGLERIRSHGGEASAAIDLPEGTARPVSDPDGAFFLMLDAGPSSGRGAA